MKIGHKLGLVLALLQACTPAYAGGFRSCSNFGHCATGFHHAAPAVVHHAQPVQSQAIVIQNNYPTPLSPQGASLYGYNTYGQAARAYQLDPAAVLAEAGRLAQLQAKVAGEGRDGYLDLASKALEMDSTVRTLQARAALLNATNPHPQTGQLQVAQANQSVKLVPDGKGGFTIQVNPQTGGGGGGNVNPSPSPHTPTGTGLGLELLRTKCASCHNGSRDNLPVFFDEENNLLKLNERQKCSIMGAIKYGAMPPESAGGALPNADVKTLREYFYPE